MSKRRNGYAAYRYGIENAAPITLAGPKPLFSKDKRRILVEGAFKALSDWRFSPFEYEGVVRANLRAALCLSGHGWDRSDATAADIVSEALKGYPRPSWKEGQRSYTIPVENCQNCGGALEDHEIARGIRFCGASCAKAATVWRDDLSAKFAGRIGKQAWYLIRKEDIPKRACDYCGTVWQPSIPDARYCSQRCIEHAQPDYIPDRPCKNCGTVFHPHTRAVEFCSTKCRFDYRLPERACLECGAMFAPNQDRARFCSKICGVRYYGKNVAPTKELPERPCRTCNEPFIPKSPKAQYCCSECRVEGSRIILPIRNCTCCGTPFQPKNDQAMYCTPKCNQRMKDRRQKEKRRAAKAANSDHPIHRLFDKAA